MTKGFCTLAVGDKAYYQLATNLLLSYRLHTKNPLSFAIICDHENEYTKLFDKVVILSHSSCSYMDKIEMLNSPPHDYNVFIDADCLVYQDINYLLDLCKNGVTLFGGTHSLSEVGRGWFDANSLYEFTKRVNYNISSHGGIMFFRKDGLTKSVYNDCKAIARHYSDFHFAMFEKPADEPIVALAMAANNCVPISRQDYYDAYGFYPTFKDCRMNILKGIMSYTFDGYNWIENVKIVHWQNRNTQKAIYRTEVKKMELFMNNSKALTLFAFLWGIFYNMQEVWDNTINRFHRKLKEMISFN